MPMEKVAFEFPDPDHDTDSDVKMKEDGSAEVVVSGRRDSFANVVSPKPKKDDEEDITIEIVDDIPKKDRNRKPSAPPEELTEEELEGHSENVRKRLKHFSKGYHDERRKAEQAAREKLELEAITSRLVEENKKLKGTVGQNQQAMLEQAKKMAARELAEAKEKFKVAYNAGEGDAVVDAQEAMTSAKLKSERVNNIKLPSLQDNENDVQTQQTAPVTVDAQATEWQKSNSWFGQDDEMTSFALGLHQKLVKQGVNPRSEDYYEKINFRMRQVFPDSFDENGGDEPEEVKPRRKTNVVAPATRSTAPRKIVLTQTQVTLAKRLGVPLEEYAKQVAMELRKQNG